MSGPVIDELRDVFNELVRIFAKKKMSCLIGGYHSNPRIVLCDQVMKSLSIGDGRDGIVESPIDQYRYLQHPLFPDALMPLRLPLMETLRGRQLTAGSSLQFRRSFQRLRQQRHIFAGNEIFVIKRL